jgi:peptide deformylase
MLPILTFPHPILAKVADEVVFPLSIEDRNLINDMWETVRGQGVGLAAPQVGVSKQLIIIHLSDAETGNESQDVVMINPRISFYSQTESLMVEGCLSYPDEYFKIWRPTNIVVEYMTEHGRKKTLRAGNWLSRVIQHEVDHLNGISFTTLGGEKIDKSELDNEVVID